MFIYQELEESSLVNKQVDEKQYLTNIFLAFLLILVDILVDCPQGQGEMFLADSLFPTLIVKSAKQLLQIILTNITSQ